MEFTEEEAGVIQKEKAFFSGLFAVINKNMCIDQWCYNVINIVIMNLNSWYWLLDFPLQNTQVSWLFLVKMPFCSSLRVNVLVYC